MYVTRPLSVYIKNPNALSLPPDGPNSGFLVIQDEESEAYSFFGLFKDRRLKDLPFPQNKALTLSYTDNASNHGVFHDAIIIPVLNLPLSSNRYYAIKPHGNHKGEAFTCSREEDMTTRCFCTSVTDIKPKPFDPRNIYQQFEISLHKRFNASSKGYFYAKSVAPDGFPPYFMRRKGWSVNTKTPKNYKLDEAPGLNTALRSRLPDFDFPLSYRTSDAVVVGKWYTPFMFVKEGTLRDQVERSPFYQVTLEQKWEQISSSQDIIHLEGESVNIDVILDREFANVAGNITVWDEKNVVEGAIWFRSHGRNGEQTTVGLSVELVKRMKWEQERGGWLGGTERQVRVERAEKFEGNGEWREFGCYVLVESFVIRRMDQSVVMTYDFKHSHQIRSRRE